MTLENDKKKGGKRVGNVFGRGEATDKPWLIRLRVEAHPIKFRFILPASLSPFFLVFPSFFFHRFRSFSLPPVLSETEKNYGKSSLYQNVNKEY